MMSSDDLKKAAIGLLEIAKKELQETKNVTPCISLWDALDGTKPECIVIADGSCMNSGPAKDRLAEMVADKINEHGYTAVMMLADTFLLEVAKENWKKVSILRRVLDVDNRTIAKLGLGKFTEQLTVSIELSSGKAFFVCQPYTRNEAGEVIEFGPLRDAGEATIESGRFKWFHDPEKAEVPE